MTFSSNFSSFILANISKLNISKVFQQYLAQMKTVNKIVCNITIPFFMHVVWWVYYLQVAPMELSTTYDEKIAGVTCTRGR